jgi:hypothetical protein
MANNSEFLELLFISCFGPKRFYFAFVIPPKVLSEGHAKVLHSASRVIFRPFVTLTVVLHGHTSQMVAHALRAIIYTAIECN